jgi:threonine aldolase
VIDLRSDTVTKPTPAMREAMAGADVGDDVYGEDPTVNALEAEVAALFGHEAGLFTPSGSMANQIAIQTLVPPGDELLCDADAHVVTYEIGAAAAIGGVSSRTWPAVGAGIDPVYVASMVRQDGYYAVPTRAIAVEQTHNRAGGAVIPLNTLQALRDIADQEGLALHCDGARIWHAHVADGVPLAEYGALFDTMSVCLSKGLGAPVGSVFVSTQDRIEHGRNLRKRLGGGMRQAGILAAAGRYALTNHIDRLAGDHERAARLATALAPYGVVDPDRVRTNVVILDLVGTRFDARGLAAAARDEGVLLSVMGPQLGRLITHLDVDDCAVDKAAEILAGLLRD